MFENLALEEYEQFDDYLEMVVQFGVSMTNQKNSAGCCFEITSIGNFCRQPGLSEAVGSIKQLLTANNYENWPIQDVAFSI